jgi:hypothetical protein
VAGSRAEEVAGKSEANEVPAKVEEKAVGNNSLILAENIALAAMNA